MAEYPNQLGPNRQAETTDPEALLATMRQRFLQAEAAEAKTRDEELEDLKFSHGEQWLADLAKRRDQDGRPCLTINQMPQYVHQVTNEQRQNRPSIRVLPQDDFADVETAKVLQGLIRHIEVDSNADVAYDTAFEAAVRSGKGYFRIVTEYQDERSFDQCVKIKRIRNRFCVYMDPASQEPDGSDANWAMVVEEMSRDVFKAQYPDAECSTMADYTSGGDGWIDTDNVRVCEYFFKHVVRRRLCLYSDGTVVEARFKPDPLPEGVEVVAEREALLPELWWVKSNGHEVLEQERFPGRYIPIVPVVGNEADINGEVTYSGIVRHAKDPQRMYNYWASSETETIALAPRAPWILAEGQDGGHEMEWAQANQRNFSVLKYKPKTLGNELLPPPQRNIQEAPVQAITNARLLSRDDLKATTGIYDASLGARSNETSGRAIVARQREGDVANFHYPDNLARSLKHAGRILVDLIPQIYSTRRIVRILGEDNEPQTVTLNAPFKDESGIERIYRTGVGRYDVVVDVGPSFATKRQETVATMLELTKAFPPLFQVAGDLLIKNMDWPGAQEIAERFQTLLPPEVRPQPKQGDPKAQLEQLRAATAQMQQKLQAMNAYAQECEAKTQELEQENAQLKMAQQSKAAELTVKQEENAAKVATEQARLALEQKKIELEEQKLALEVAKTQAEVGEIQARLLQEHQRVTAEQEATESLAHQNQQAVTEALAAVGEQLAALAQMIQETQTTPEGKSRVERRPTDNGFTGEGS